jgi:hypothetical protein
LGANPSVKSAGFVDVSDLMGDLPGYINRATELGCIDPSKYFSPNNLATRGEAFKIAACVMKSHAQGNITESKIPSLYKDIIPSQEPSYNSASSIDQDIISNVTDVKVPVNTVTNPYGPYVSTPISQVQYALGSTP